MRPQQQNRRMRGRNNNGGGNNNNNNNRKGPNPLNRNYESNGPDVKIRGSAQQIAEKYATLARDAQSSGDRVMAENYLQHAEHYNRIIAAAQAQMPIQQAQQNRDDDDDGDDNNNDAENNANNNGSQSPVAAQGSGPQPDIDGIPAEVALKSGGGRENGGRRGRDNRNSNAGQNDQRNGNGARGEQSDAENEDQTEASTETVAPAAQQQPEEALGPAALAARAELNETTTEAAAPPRRPRRPRRPKVAAEPAQDETEQVDRKTESETVDSGPVETAPGDVVTADS